MDFEQLSQTASLNVNYILSKNKSFPQNINFNYNLNDVANEQGGIVRIGDASTFHNFNAGHTINLAERQLTINTGINATYNTIGREDATTLGPNLNISKQLFNKTLTTQFSSAYNITKNTTSENSAINLRFGANYSYKKKHNFNANAIQLFKNSDNIETLSELTATVGYNYAFGLKKPKIQFPEWKRKYSDSVKINYKKYRYNNIPKNITPQLLAIPNNDSVSFLRNKSKIRLIAIEKELLKAEKEDKKLYKVVAIQYLKCLDDYINFESKYYNLTYFAILKLKEEANSTTEKFEKELVYLVAESSKSNQRNKRSEHLVLQAKKRLEAHLKLVKTLNQWDVSIEKIQNPPHEFKPLISKYLKICFNKFDEGNSDDIIIKFLEVKWASFFHEKSQNSN